MAVVYYQLAIILSLILISIFKKEWLLAASILWSLETLIMLFYPPLIIIQLIVVWGTFFLINKYTSKTHKLKELEQYINTKPAQIPKLIQTLPNDKFKTLSGKKHRDFLMHAIISAEKTLSILSGWITKYALDTSLFSILENALNRGIIIYIGYGYQDSSGKHKPLDSSELAIEQLKNLQNKYPNHLKIFEFANHEKILIKDSDFVVYGSNNWLSNKKFKNSERSIIVYNSELTRIKQERIENIYNKRYPKN